jgi:hypothetical protein
MIAMKKEMIDYACHFVFYYSWVEVIIIGWLYRIPTGCL